MQLICYFVTFAVYNWCICLSCLSIHIILILLMNNHNILIFDSFAFLSSVHLFLARFIDELGDHFNRKWQDQTLRRPAHPPWLVEEKEKEEKESKKRPRAKHKVWERKDKSGQHLILVCKPIRSDREKMFGASWKVPSNLIYWGSWGHLLQP